MLVSTSPCWWRQTTVRNLLCECGWICFHLAIFCTSGSFRNTMTGKKEGGRDTQPWSWTKQHSTVWPAITHSSWGGTGSKSMFNMFLSTGETTGLLFPADLFGSFMSLVIFLEQCCWRTAGENGLMTAAHFSRMCWSAVFQGSWCCWDSRRKMRLPESSWAERST